MSACASSNSPAATADCARSLRVGLTATGIGMTTAFALGGIVGYAFGAGLLGLAWTMTTTLRDIRTFPGLLAELREEHGWSQS